MELNVKALSNFGTKPIGRWIVGTTVAPRLASVSLA